MQSSAQCEANHDLIRSFFNKLENKELVSLVGCFELEALFIDPHYPLATMVGHQQILEGLTWSAANIEKFNFKIVEIYSMFSSDSAAKQSKHAVEAIAMHLLKNGTQLYTPQVFIFEIKDSKITKLQSYSPYGPPGILSVILRITRVYRRAKLLFHST